MGGRKLVVSPAGTPAWEKRRPQVESALVKAIARAFRWRRLLEKGSYTTIEELAAAERINPSYVSRVLRLTLLAPEIVDAILNGTASPDITMVRLFRTFPVDWTEQERVL